MKYLIALVIVFSGLSLQAKTLDVCKKELSIEQTAGTHNIDKKKSRRHKKMNRKRKRACNNWAKRSYAG